MRPEHPKDETVRYYRKLKRGAAVALVRPHGGTEWIWRLRNTGLVVGVADVNLPESAFDSVEELIERLGLEVAE
jgi:hypothetical protein